MNAKVMLIKWLRRYFPWVRNLYLYKIKTGKAFTRILNPYRWHNLRQLHPVSDMYGLDRGQSVDRFYMEKFLSQNKHLIRGNVLEVLDDAYTQKFGGKKVKHSDILDIDRKNKFATIYDDLRHLKKIKPNQYDCIILTQVLQFIDDNPTAVGECFKILKKQGVLLATLPCFSRTDVASGISGDYWRYTAAGVQLLFGKVFGNKNITVRSWGNVLSGTAFWQGISWEELESKELAYNDPHFPLIISVKAVKR